MQVSNAIAASKGIPFLKVYANTSSKDYKALSKSVMNITTDFITPGIGGPMRVVLLHDLERLVLQTVAYNEKINWLEPKHTFFSISGKKGDVFEFNAIFTEGIPQGWLVAEYNANAVFYPLQESGVDGLPDGLILEGQSTL